MKTSIQILMLGLSLFAGMHSVYAASDDTYIARGRYLIATSGCNDCHTDGYLQSNGNVPVSKWLLGSSTGFQGPWGTTYPANLRISMHSLTEQQWLSKARTAMRPPMPWFNLRDMTDADLLSIFHFVRSLKPAGEAAPAYKAPGELVTTPYFEFVPKNLPRAEQAKR